MLLEQLSRRAKQPERNAYLFLSFLTKSLLEPFALQPAYMDYVHACTIGKHTRAANHLQRLI